MGWTPLHKAVGSNNLEIAQVLLADSRIDVNKPDNSGRTALWWAACKDKEEIAALCFIETTPESKNNTIKMLQLLLENGADVNKKDNNGETPLHVASHSNDDPEIMKVLLADKTTELNHVSSGMKMTPLQAALWFHKTEQAKLLLQDERCDVDQVNKEGNTPLHNAVSINNKEIVTLLIKKRKADVNKGASTPFHEAIIAHYLDIAQLLIEESNGKIDINKATESGWTPLHTAIGNEYAGVSSNRIKFLLDQPDIKVNKATKNGTTPLMVLVAMKSKWNISVDTLTQCLQLFLKHPNINVNKNRTSAIK